MNTTNDHSLEQRTDEGSQELHGVSRKREIVITGGLWPESE